MAIASPDQTRQCSPLEHFIRDYVETVGGVWDEIEPQVYDILLPEAADQAVSQGQSPLVLRLALDPEALPEHPQAQLASLGTPAVDRMLQSALKRGRAVDLYLSGLNLQPHQLPAKAARAVTLPAGTALDVHRARLLDFPQMAFWFEATFITDQREQEILPAAIDLHYGRQVRHLDALLDAGRLSESSSVSLPEIPGCGRAAAYLTARDQVLRSVVSLANMRARELAERLERQTVRLTRYYDDLRQELEEQAARAAARQEPDQTRFLSRRTALDHERQLRIAELRKKTALSVRLRLLNLLVIHQPKILLLTSVVNQPAGKASTPIPLALVWDPLVEAIEAVPCPLCGRPTFELASHRSGLACPGCPAASLEPVRRKPR